MINKERSKMTDYFLSISSGTGENEDVEPYEHAYGGLLIIRGSLRVNGHDVIDSNAALLRKGDTFELAAESQWVRFDFSKDAPIEPVQIGTKIILPLSTGASDVLLRMDEVEFPPGAVAYRHVHPGDGIRFLIEGQLQLIADHHEEVATPGHAWFEAANSPVRAEASPDHTTTRFVRFMILPPACLGKATINILDEDEAKLPRQQATRRHFDEIVHLDLG